MILKNILKNKNAKKQLSDKENKFVWRLTRLIYIVFFPIFWLIRKNKELFFTCRMGNAIKTAEKRAKNSTENIVAVQIEKSFFVGTRTEMRNINKRGKKAVKRLTKSNLLNFDYRTAIIYSTKNMNEFRSLIEKNGWKLYQTGCPCKGLPRYFKNAAKPEYKIILKGGYCIVKRGGAVILKTKDFNLFKSENWLIG
jgi:hypothetical protein